MYDAAGQRLFLVGGSFDGRLEILHVNTVRCRGRRVFVFCGGKQRMSLANGARRRQTGVTHVQSLPGGHTGVVRSIAWDLVRTRFG